MRLNVIGLIENMSYYVCACCGEKSRLFPKCDAKELAMESGVEYFGDLPFNQSLCQHFDDVSGTEEFDLVDLFDCFTDKILIQLNKS